MSTEPIQLNRSSSVDRNGKRIGQIEWYVPIRPTQAAIAAVENFEATVNSAFPDEPGNVLDRFDNRPADDGIGTIVTGLYSSDKSFELVTRQDRDDPNNWTFSLVSVWGEIVVPYAVRRNVTVNGVPSGEPLWHAAEQSKKQAMERVTVQVAVENWDLGMTRAVRKQAGKIHTIPVEGEGTQYKFEGVQVTPRIVVTGGKKVYDVTYTWLGDPGNKAATFPNTDSNIAFPNIDRGPFGEYYIRPPWSDGRTPPAFGVRYNHDQTAFDGWESLPGMPDL